MGKSTLDGTKTSREWAQANPKVVVFPIGAFEQHSTHLPLAADDIEADYFGRFLALELGAALLPTLNFGTSLEHSGFRGTVSLRPETLMQIVRDIADEVECQGFHTMIIVNGHGGNFALTPVVRDINRRDRRLKILLVDFWRFADEELLESHSRGILDLHSSEFETSLFLALHPELVRTDRPDMRPRVRGFQQPDLTTFGVSYFAPKGALGRPSCASATKGQKIIASIKRNMLRHVRQRLAWLQKNRHYSGKGQTR